MNKTKKFHQNKVSKLLLMLTLVMGILTFSGFSGNTRSIVAQKATQTEVGRCSSPEAGYRTISFQYALSLHRLEPACWHQNDWKMALLSFDNLMQVKLASIGRGPCPKRPIFCSHLTRMIPQSSDEEEPFSA